MGWLKRRTGLERAALAALVATVVAVAIVAFGLLDADRPEVARRVTALCAPLSRAAVTSDESVGATRRDVVRLRHQTEATAEGLGTLLKDTHGGVRRDVGAVYRWVHEASDPFGAADLPERARYLATASAAAGRLGASCPAPLTVDAAKVVNERLRP